MAAAPRPPLRVLTAWLCRRVPALDSLRNYSPHALGADLLAGLTVAAVAVPQAMAYASIAGLPPQYGLYTAIVMTAVGALFDSSRQLINGPTNAISIALLSALARRPGGERVPAAVLLALLVGLVQMGITLLRLGDLTRYISHAVIVGFTARGRRPPGARPAQEPARPAGAGRAQDHFLTRFWLTMLHGGAGQRWPTVLIGVGTIVLVVALRWSTAVLRRAAAVLPEFLLAVVVMAALVVGASISSEQRREGRRRRFPRDLPAFQLPEIDWDRVRLLAGNALAIARAGAAGSARHGQGHRGADRAEARHQPAVPQRGPGEPGRQLLPVLPGSGSLTRSAINQQAGAVTQWSGVDRGGAVAATMLLFAPLAAVHPAGGAGRHPDAGGVPHGGPRAARLSPAGDALRRRHRARRRPWRRSPSRSSSASSSASSCRSSCTSRGRPRSS